MVCQVIEASREKLPSNLAENFEGLAKAEARNKSQLFKEMLTLYARARVLHRCPAVSVFGSVAFLKNSVYPKSLHCCRFPPVAR